MASVGHAATSAPTRSGCSQQTCFTAVADSHEAHVSAKTSACSSNVCVAPSCALSRIDRFIRGEDAIDEERYRAIDAERGRLPRPEPNAHVLRETLGMSDRITELVTDEALE
jgi:hypothetical protein